MNEKQLQRYAIKCKHFNGVQHDSCESGVAYDDVIDRTKSIDEGRLPCLRAPHDRCVRYEAIGIERAEEIDQEVRDSFVLVMTARALLLSAMDSQKSIDSDTCVVEVQCPKCNTGALRGARASNGHIHARCSTAECLAWME